MSSYANGIRYSERIFGMKNHPLRRDRIISTAWDDRDVMCFEFLYTGIWGIDDYKAMPAAIKKQIEAHEDFAGWEDAGVTCDCCMMREPEYATDSYGDSICKSCWDYSHCDKCYEPVRIDLTEQLYWVPIMSQHLCQDCYDDRK